MARIKKPTTTTLVMEQLRTAPDFLSRAMLVRLTGCSASQVAAALFHLHRHRCADVVVNADGTGWWFALPADHDDRCRVINEIVGYVKPNRRKTKGVST